MKRPFIASLGLLVFSIILFSSCGSSNQIRSGDSLEEAFDKAVALYDRERYGDAASSFETVITIGRGTDIGQEAQFLLAESYYKNRQYLLAAAEYQRYHTFFPRSERAADAQFQEALSYYQISPRYNLDQSDTYESIELFQLFVNRHPEHSKADEAIAYIDEMRAKLARKRFEAAEQYITLRNYRAAAVYYDITVDRFPETKWAERAQANKIRAYVIYADNSVRARQPERYEEAIEAYETYVQLFPRGDNRSLAEEFYNRAEEGLLETQPSEATAGTGS
ncbi:MAG: outer membrane protein assembly factor BamD [Cyclonatronaceae bacterium]